MERRSLGDSSSADVNMLKRGLTIQGEGHDTERLATFFLAALGDERKGIASPQCTCAHGGWFVDCKQKRRRWVDLLSDIYGPKAKGSTTLDAIDQWIDQTTPIEIKTLKTGIPDGVKAGYINDGVLSLEEYQRTLFIS